mmetsp:Transcript_19589/g.44456  ORF Transcript_19589/g.44456 Transcript_19589/m.44456 type:complete len:438 (+) Transcript_19589:535-1848(+)
MATKWPSNIPPRAPARAQGVGQRVRGDLRRQVRQDARLGGRVAGGHRPRVDGAGPRVRGDGLVQRPARHHAGHLLVPHDLLHGRLRRPRQPRPRRRPQRDGGLHRGGGLRQGRPAHLGRRRRGAGAESGDHPVLRHPRLLRRGPARDGDGRAPGQPCSGGGRAAGALLETRRRGLFRGGQVHLPLGPLQGHGRLPLRLRRDELSEQLAHGVLPRRDRHQLHHHLRLGPRQDLGRRGRGLSSLVGTSRSGGGNQHHLHLRPDQRAAPVPLRLLLGPLWPPAARRGRPRPYLPRSNRLRRRRRHRRHHGRRRDRLLRLLLRPGPGHRHDVRRRHRGGGRVGGPVVALLCGRLVPLLARLRVLDRWPPARLRDGPVLVPDRRGGDGVLHGGGDRGLPRGLRRKPGGRARYPPSKPRVRQDRPLRGGKKRSHAGLVPVGCI